MAGIKAVVKSTFGQAVLRACLCLWNKWGAFLLRVYFDTGV